jgi:phage terminase large subunit-like protein
VTFVQLATPRRMTTAQLDRLARRWECDVPECDGQPHAGMLHKHARWTQREPTRPGWRVWLILAGRGWGKTRTGSETIKKWAGATRRGHYAVIAKGHKEVLEVCFEARRAGLVEVIDPDSLAEFKRGLGSVKLVLTNGSVVRAFSAAEPDAIRGYAFDAAWCDEFAAWPKNTAQDMWDQLWFCLREAEDPKVVVTTTPKALAHVKTLVNRARTDASVVLTKGRTVDNRAR